MSSANFVELSSDEEIGKSGGKKSKRSLDSVLGTVEHKQNNRTKCKKVRRKSRSGQELEENISSVACTISQNGSSVLDQGPSPLDKSSPSSVPGLGSASICRQFWKAGNYNLGEGSKTQHQNGANHLCVHPMFLHSNATSHKWAFGAIAELLDNAVDEIQNGATSVVIDKTTNPRDGNPALLIQDDGGGMDPETIRRCMSFGFSNKKTKSSIGQYGNGFKTGSMRLGADVILFTRCLKKRTLSQSVGLLSYTFLRQSGHDRIIVPLLDYEFNPSTEKSEPIFSYGKEQFSSNLSVLLRWSPYSTEEMLLKQFDDVGHHGTKIVIYNLWLNDNGDTELDFDFDMEDIRVNGDPKLLRSSSKNSVFDHHIANLYQFSLRVYSSFLYLRLPQDFKIILRGRVVEHHNIADDLRFHEFILYKPHGWSCYYYRIFEGCSSCEYPWVQRLPQEPPYIGILEVNFIEPTHDKQDFEKTSVFQKLEARLKDMTMEYWHLHCGLIGYQLVKKKPTKPKPSQDLLSKANRFLQPLVLNQRSSASVDVQPVSPAVESSEDVGATSSYDSTRPEKFVNNGPTARRKEQNPTGELEHGKCQLGSRSPSSDTPPNGVKQAPQSRENQLKEQELTSMMQENKKLCSQLLELEKGEKDLNLKVQQLWSLQGNLESKYVRMLAELDAIDKDERNTDG